MDIEHLSKVQIVLLTLLVSFVTSIATGIVTVSLMEKAPPTIAQTVNRVIERTVETVVPSAQTGAVAAHDQATTAGGADLTAQAVRKVLPSVVRLFTSDSESPTFIGLGVVLDGSGTIAADIGSLGENADALVQLRDGSSVRAFVSARDNTSGVAFLTSATSTKEGGVPAWTPIAPAAAHVAELGESVVIISGNTVPRISSGIVTALIPPSAENAPRVVDTSVSEAVVMAGSPFISQTGELLGMSTSVSRASSATGFVPASALIKKAAAESQ